MKTENEEGFLSSVIYLMFSQVIIKLFGLAYSMYLINKEGFGDSGNAIYMGGYQMYVLLLTISSIGVPNAVSKLVAEKVALKDYKGAKKVFKIACMVFGFIGLLGSIILFTQAKNISKNFLSIPECEYSLIALSPAVFFVSVGAVIKGYFNGISQISKTAKSQTIEQIFKSVFTIAFVEIISRLYKNTTLMASTANFASSISIFCSFIYIVKTYITLNKIQKVEEMKQGNFKSERTITIIKKILEVSIPITFSAILGTLGRSIDSVTVVKLLTPIVGENSAKLRYGILSSKIDMLTMMPLAFNIAFATTLVPKISSAKAKGNIDYINEKLKVSLLITSVIALPSSAGLGLYSKEILNLLFPSASSGAEMLRISAFSIMFMALTQTINGALHGIGKARACVVALSIEVIIKTIINYVLIPIPYIYEKGAVIGNVISNIISFIIVWGVLKRNIKLDFNLGTVTLRPIFATVIMMFSSYYMYLLFINKIPSRILIILVIGLAIIFYIISLFLLGIFKKEALFAIKNAKKRKKFKKCAKLKTLGNSQLQNVKILQIAKNK